MCEDKALSLSLPYLVMCVFIDNNRAAKTNTSDINEWLRASWLLGSFHCHCHPLLFCEFTYSDLLSTSNSLCSNCKSKCECATTCMMLYTGTWSLQKSWRWCGSKTFQLYGNYSQPYISVYWNCGTCTYYCLQSISLSKLQIEFVML